MKNFTPINIDVDTFQITKEYRGRTDFDLETVIEEGPLLHRQGYPDYLIYKLWFDGKIEKMPLMPTSELKVFKDLLNKYQSKLLSKAQQSSFSSANNIYGNLYIFKTTNQLDPIYAWELSSQIENDRYFHEIALVKADEVLDVENFYYETDVGYGALQLFLLMGIILVEVIVISILFFSKSIKVSKRVIRKLFKKHN